MRARTALTLTLCLCALACRKDEATADPGSGGGLMGLDVSPGSEGGGPARDSGEDVPVKCITDPGDPDCAEVLGATQTDSGDYEFGEACRKNVCHGRGDCYSDADGAVACDCDEGAGGLNCEKRKR